MKNKRLKLGVNFIIAIIIIIGFLTMGTFNYINYSKIIKQDIQNISKLTSTNIYSQINNEIIKPIFVSLTMANDAFVKDWIEEEDTNDSEKLINYLKGIKDKYQYNSVFLVSEDTQNYYHFDGINKKVSADNDHDIWYFDFIESGEMYDLDVDFDEAANQQLTVFVNCKINDAKGKLLGVTGVGVNMNSIQDVLKDYEEKFFLEAFLVDKNGLVQIHTDSSMIEHFNMFENTELVALKENILNNKEGSTGFNLEDKRLSGYYISRYIEELDWYLIVKKDTSVLFESFLAQMVKDIVILAIVLAVVLIIITQLVNKFKNQLTHMAQTDQLTGIYNRRVFDNFLEQTFKSSTAFAVIVLDIDKFKNINDTYGHIFGDDVIRKVAQRINDELTEPDIVSRWGGDEFGCIVFSEQEVIIEKIKSIQDAISKDELLSNYSVTLSIGIAYYKEGDTRMSIVRRADEGMYFSKRNGRNQFKVCEEELNL